MMEDSKSGMSWIAVLFVILIIWAIFGGGFGNWGNAHQNTPVVLNGDSFGGCNRVSNCEIERREIIDSATTQYQVEQQGAATRTAVSEGVATIVDQNNRLYIQGLNEKLYDLKMENQTLKGQIYSDAKFNALTTQISDCCCGFNRRMDAIEAQMLTKPLLSGVAATAAGQVIPASFYTPCGCGANI
jgi:hypothetical protein